MKRLTSLDYLRGLSAFGIMVFHYSMWSFGLFSAGDFLGRVGIYGVPVFYVLSGLTLFHVYYHKMGQPSLPGLADFYIKRFFRIFPLLWLLSLATLVFENNTYSAKTIFFSFSGLFSISDWVDTICYGAWSIGNELVFYLFFPVFVFLAKKSRLAFLLFAFMILMIYLWFTFVHFNSSGTLADFWTDYTNPLNHVFLFLGGFAMGLYSENLRVSKPLSLSLITICLAAFIWLPASGDSIHLVAGFTRIAFTLICFVTCFCFYKTDFGLPGPGAGAFQALGEISYSLYLVHPVTWYILGSLLKQTGLHLNTWVHLFTGFVFSLVVAYAIYRLYERFFMNMGKKLSKKWISAPLQ